MLDFNYNNNINIPGVDFQTFVASNQQQQTNYNCWIKPRGVKWVYILAVGGGGSGGCGVTTGTTSGGGGGGGSGCQVTFLTPAMFLPDVLFIYSAGSRGVQGTSGAVPTYGGDVRVTFEPYVNTPWTLLIATPAQGGGTAATTTTGGTGGTATTVGTSLTLANKGIYTTLNGQAGGNGGSSTSAGSSVTLPTTGLFVTGGAGGGGSNGTTAFDGGGIIAPASALGLDFFPSVSGGTAANGATPATLPIFLNYKVRNFLMNYGGVGGGGGTTTSGGLPGPGADGAPGCGGGGGGGGNTTSLAAGGNGGPGFCMIMSW